MKGLVLGVYTDSDHKDIKTQSISGSTQAFKDVDEKCNGALSKILNSTGPFKSSTAKIFWTQTFKTPKLEYDCIAVVDLRSKEAKDDTLEGINQRAENVRCAIAVGVLALDSCADFEDIYLDSCGSAQSAAEAAYLALHTYDELKSKRKHRSNVRVYEFANMEPDTLKNFRIGVLLAESQNFARYLMEAPANHMTPTIFASKVEEKFKNTKVKVIVRDLEWIESMKMGSFLSVARGSDQPPKFIELHYEGQPGSDKCIALVGKGITFDCGGISIKAANHMDKMRADMGGAATVVSSIFAVSSLGLKINVKGFMPMTENIINGSATKPGDVVKAMNGKTIQVDNTDAEGRLVLPDGLIYAHRFKPTFILDLATLTNATIISLGPTATAVFSNDDHLFNLLQKAGYFTGDRMWRMPLFKFFAKTMTGAELADFNNIGNLNITSIACKAAAYLREFIEPDMKWMHLDIAGVMMCSGETPYMVSGMSGRPTRTLVQFLKSLVGEI